MASENLGHKEAPLFFRLENLGLQQQQQQQLEGSCCCGMKEEILQ